MTQVRFMVEPLSIYKSGAPIISVEGSENEKRKKEKRILIKYREDKVTINDGGGDLESWVWDG